MYQHQSLKEMLANRGALTREEQTRLDAHVRDCVECQALSVSYCKQTALIRTYKRLSPRTSVALPAEALLESTTLAWWKRSKYRAGAVGILAVLASIPFSPALAGQLSGLFGGQNQNPCNVAGKMVLPNATLGVTPQQYESQGGHLFPWAVAAAAKLPEVQYVLVRDGAGFQELSCRRGETETAVEVGIDEKTGTQLLAISWHPTVPIQQRGR